MPFSINWSALERSRQHQESSPEKLSGKFVAYRPLNHLNRPNVKCEQRFVQVKVIQGHVAHNA